MQQKGIDAIKNIKLPKDVKAASYEERCDFQGCRNKLQHGARITRNEVGGYYTYLCNSHSLHWKQIAAMDSSYQVQFDEDIWYGDVKHD